MFGEYPEFIVPAYLITAAAILVTTAHIFITYRKRRNALQQLEDESR